MKRVLIIGATGTVGRAVRQTLIRETDAHLTLFARHRIFDASADFFLLVLHTRFG